MKRTKALERLRQFESAHAESCGFEIRILQPDKPYRDWYTAAPRVLFEALSNSVSAREVVNKFGVYIFDSADEVVYVGKATPRLESVGRSGRYNLLSEIASKFGSPTLPAIEFSKGVLAGKVRRLSEAAGTAWLSGSIHVTAVVIEPWYFAASLEAFLQASALALDGRLPCLNDRIG